MNAPSIKLEGNEYPVVRPASASDLGAVIRTATEALFPLGGCTMLGVGLPPARSGIGVDLTALDRVIDYPARDMTITVEAGITIQRLQDLLHKEGQRLPIDAPAADRATTIRIGTVSNPANSRMFAIV